MIGILGPRDSVSLVLQVAAELGRTGDLVARAYDEVGEAVGLARSLETACDVLLFTGVLPFDLARRAGAWKCELQVIQHSHADLYRVIGLILKQSRGTFPRVSVDTVGAEVVQRVFVDMDLPVPDIIIPVIDAESGILAQDIESMARAHLDALGQGAVQAALTCLDGTYQVLRDSGVSVWRIDHARSTIADALQRAWLASELKRTAGNSIVVVLLEVKESMSGQGADAAKARDAVARAVNTHSRRMGSHAVKVEDRYTLTTTRAAIDEVLHRHRNGQRSLIDLSTKPPAGVVTTLGIGHGGTFATALDSAEKALQFARSSGEAVMVQEDGTVQSLASDTGMTTTLQETSVDILNLSEKTGLGPLTLRRLTAALGRSDQSGTTAQQLGEAYGVTPRYARTMLVTLVEAGFAREVGVRATQGAGRPHVVYDVDRSRLSQIMTSQSGPNREASPAG